MLVWIAAAWAQPHTLEDVGDSTGPTVLIVGTPGVAPLAYLDWIRAIEDQGGDAWLLQFPAREQSPEQIVDAVRVAAGHVPDLHGVAAHGYAGVFTLLADLTVERLALVGVPLGPQATPVVLEPRGALVADGLPWSPDLLGPLPQVPLSGAVAAAYAAWTLAPPELPVPQGACLVLASDADVVAPPETVRRPSQGWPDRTFERVGFMSGDPADPTHGALLTHARAAQLVARFVVSS